MRTAREWANAADERVEAARTAGPEREGALMAAASLLSAMGATFALVEIAEAAQHIAQHLCAGKQPAPTNTSGKGYL